MKQNWEELIGKRILLRQKYLSTISITEATVVKVSESGKYVKFRWESGSESWEVPEEEYSFSYDKILEVLEPKGAEAEAKSGKDPSIHITFPEEESEQESEIYNGGIYETLKPNECYLVTKKGDSVLVVTNKDGKIEVKWVSITNEDDAMASMHAIGAGRAIGAGINTLLKMLSEQESAIAKEGKTAGPKFNVVPIKAKEPDIVSNPLTGKIETHDDNTSVPKSKVDTSSIRHTHKNF